MLRENTAAVIREITQKKDTNEKLNLLLMAINAVAYNHPEVLAFLGFDEAFFEDFDLEYDAVFDDLEHDDEVGLFIRNNSETPNIDSLANVLEALSYISDNKKTIADTVVAMLQEDYLVKAITEEALDYTEFHQKHGAEGLAVYLLVLIVVTHTYDQQPEI